MPPPFPNKSRIYLTFDSDLSPTDLNIERDHLLIKDLKPTKYEVSGAKRSRVISYTRLRDTDLPTDMCKAICPSLFKGGSNNVNLSIFVFCYLTTWAPGLDFPGNPCQCSTSTRSYHHHVYLIWNRIQIILLKRHKVNLVACIELKFTPYLHVQLYMHVYISVTGQILGKLLQYSRTFGVLPFKPHIELGIWIPLLAYKHGHVHTITGL